MIKVFENTDGSWTAHLFPHAEAVGATPKDAVHHLALLPGVGILLGSNVLTSINASWGQLTFSDIVNPSFTDVDSETYNAAIVAHEAAKGRGQPVYLRVVERGGKYEVEDWGMARVLGYGATEEAALRMACRSSRIQGVYSPTSPVRGLDHEGQPLAEKTLTQWAA
ncbi:hypothetical protein W911_14615 [Hyphomicrobium nitrativorans NL23]|uniref:Uncharacterized protein n=1 Tax=Hyphomicrobium nitrativorans NL23 TaxID=1029756 RepID=V5SJT7_9HYPH|nr:hypothetical protein [Hyphomicrobium nitrativorans]AHB50345.1 hypothetical protein W911_14615 [Hyphomicrobium nitrativorans NL23]